MKAYKNMNKLRLFFQICRNYKHIEDDLLSIECEGYEPHFICSVLYDFMYVGAINYHKN